MLKDVTLKRLAASFGVVVVLAACDGTIEPIPMFDVSRVMNHVEIQCAFGPRLPNSAARDSAAAYLARVTRGCGATVRTQSFELDDPYGERTLQLVNVIASFEPRRTKRVMLAAHYDTRPWADQDDTDSLRAIPVPGAVDCATGVGVLLEIGRLLSHRMPDGIGIDLVFFDGEDYGKAKDLEFYLLGSKHFAANLEGYRPRSMILLDMVGGKSTQIAREAYSRTNSPELLDELFRRAAVLGLDYFVDLNAPAIYDDHVPMIKAGIPAVDLFGYNYKHWHTTRDTPDKCDPGKLAQVGILLLDFLYDYPF